MNASNGFDAEKMTAIVVFLVSRKIIRLDDICHAVGVAEATKAYICGKTLYGDEFKCLGDPYDPGVRWNFMSPKTLYELLIGADPVTCGGPGRLFDCVGIEDGTGLDPQLRGAPIPENFEVRLPELYLKREPEYDRYLAVTDKKALEEGILETMEFMF